MAFFRRVVAPQRDGTFVVDLDAQDRELLASLPNQLRQVLDEAPDDPGLRRLFPPAYAQPNLAAQQEEYQRLMGDDVLASRHHQLEVLATTATKERLDEDELVGWMHALNDLRLFLGTRLDVSEETDLEDYDDDDPAKAGYALYAWLGWLQENVIAALSSAI